MIRKFFIFNVCILFLHFGFLQAMPAAILRKLVEANRSFEMNDLTVRSQPVKKETDLQSDYEFCCATMQGYRDYQEDTFDFAHDSELGIDFFAVFDGHGKGGDLISGFLRDNYFSTFKRMSQGKELDQVLFTNVLADIEQGLDIRLLGRYSGSTAVTAFIFNEDGGRRVLKVANTGDSRAILVQKKGFKILSEDHSPDLEREKERVLSAGGIIRDVDGVQRVGGCLAMTRSVGDFDIGGIISRPDIVTYELTDDDLYLVLASDGLWDVIKNEGVAGFVNEKQKLGWSAEKIARFLVKQAFERGSKDNITVIVVKLAE